MADLTSRAIALLAQGDLDGARALFQFDFDQEGATFGADSPVLAIELSNLGNVLAEQHDLAGARAVLERALALHERMCVGQMIQRWRLILGIWGWSYRTLVSLMPPARPSSER